MIDIFHPHRPTSKIEECIRENSEATEKAMRELETNGKKAIEKLAKKNPKGLTFHK